jgi:hypothetical protein
MAVGIVNQAFVGFPKGYDAFGHMSKIRFLVDYFPNVDWNSEWYAGQFYSEGSFPALFHYIGGLLVFGGVSTSGSLVLIAAVSFITIGCALYGLVRVAGGSRWTAVVAALLLVGSSGYWVYIIEGGLYPRIVAMAFLALFIFFATTYQVNRSRIAYLAMVLSLAATLSSHLLVGAIALAFSVLFILALPGTGPKRIYEAVRLLLPAGLLVMYFYLPYAGTFSRPAPLPLFTRDYTALPLSALLVPGTPGGQFESLPFFLVPLAVGIPLAALLAGRLPGQALARRLMVVCGIAGAASLVYAFYGLPSGLFIYAFQPGQALFFASWFMATLIGLALIGLRPPLPVMAGATGVLLVFALVASADMARGVVNGDNALTNQMQSAMQVSGSERQFRIADNFDGPSGWIGSQAEIPQTDGYQQQGVLQPDWQYWLQTAVWSRSPNYEEVNFLLDWYAVRWVYGGLDKAVVQRFDTRPDLYQLLRPDLPSDAQAFEFSRSGPILSARSTRTALVIGDSASYALLVRAVALSGFDSSMFIPIRGGQYLDDYSAADLAQFSQVILYGYRVHDQARAFALLAQYVSAGGSAYVEAGNSSLDASDSPPASIPGARIVRSTIGPGWDLQDQGSPITAGIDLSSFSPAIYQGGPWGVSYIPATDIAAWARPVLTSNGRPLMVAGILGKGRVVWSGMNLPYHAQSTQNAVESELLAQLLAWSAPSSGGDPSFQTTFLNPQQRRITILTPATGVLMKENWVANWQVTVNGRPAGIVPAGPDFIYVPLAKNTSYPAQVEFQFVRSPAEWFGDAVSIASLVGLVLYACAGAPRWLRRRARSGSPPAEERISR